MTTTHAAVPAGSGAHDELVEQLDAHVREVVRREGVDPQRDAGVVRRIAESVVRDHDERSLTGVVAAVPDADAVVGELVARVSGFGPLQPFLDDPAVEELWINDPSRGFSAVNIRKFVLRANRLPSLVELGSLSPRAAAFLEASVRRVEHPRRRRHPRPATRHVP